MPNKPLKITDQASRDQSADASVDRMEKRLTDRLKERLLSVKGIVIGLMAFSGLMTGGMACVKVYMTSDAYKHADEGDARVERKVDALSDSVKELKTNTDDIKFFLGVPPRPTTRP